MMSNFIHRNLIILELPVNIDMKNKAIPITIIIEFIIE